MPVLTPYMISPAAIRSSMKPRQTSDSLHSVRMQLDRLATTCDGLDIFDRQGIAGE